MRRGSVPNKPLREAFLRSGATCSDVATRMGLGTKGSGDVSVALGLRPYTETRRDGTSYRSTRTHVTEATALKLGDALNLDPFEIGL